jgi:hypothetical protein
MIPIKQLLIALVVLAMPSAAQAFTDVGPRVTLPDGPFSLTCHPLGGPTSGDRHPTVRIIISMNLDASDDWAARTFEVVHQLWSGRAIIRDDQYVGRVSKACGKAQWYWTGVLQRNPSVSMIGTLYKNSQVGWRYQETVYKNGRVDQAFPEVDCSQEDDGARNDARR